MSENKPTFPLKFATSRREYRCDGCQGEFLIPEDTLYARTAYKDGQGHVHGMVLCMRCVCALGNKQRHATREIRLEPGCFRLQSLSSNFRKKWQEFITRAQELEGKPDGDGLTTHLLDELGIQTATTEEEKRMAEEKKEAKVKRQMHREKRELQAFQRRVAEQQKKLVGMMDTLATLHLKETLAWTRGDQKAIEAAKTAYGVFVKEIRAAIEEMVPESKETEK